MVPKKIFGQRIFQLRKTAGLTQKQLGEEVGLSMQAINDIEKGRRETTQSKLTAIADYFNVPADYLLGRGPFTDWDKVMQYHDAVCKTIMEEAPFLKSLPIPLAELPEKEFMGVVSATLSSIAFNEEDGHPHFTLTFFPFWLSGSSD